MVSQTSSAVPGEGPGVSAQADAAAGTDPWRAPDVSSGKGEADENFPVGSLLFAPGLREHIHAYYDFARFSDDVADSDLLTPEEKVARLNAMEDILRGRAEAPPRKDARSAARLRTTILRTGLPFEVASDLLVAFRQDAVQARCNTQADLDRYCRYSAAPVGRFLLELHGESPATLPASDALCASLQILNHLQDCQDDLRRLNRCYIPMDLLQAHGLTPEALLGPSAGPEMRAVFDTLLDEVDRLNERSLALLHRVQVRRMRMYCGAVASLAHQLAAKLRAGDPLASRVALSKTDFARAGLAAFRAWKR